MFWSLRGLLEQNTIILDRIGMPTKMIRHARKAGYSFRVMQTTSRYWIKRLAHGDDPEGSVFPDENSLQLRAEHWWRFVSAALSADHLEPSFLLWRQQDVDTLYHEITHAYLDSLRELGVDPVHRWVNEYVGMEMVSGGGRKGQPTSPDRVAEEAVAWYVGTKCGVLLQCIRWVIALQFPAERFVRCLDGEMNDPLFGFTVSCVARKPRTTKREILLAIKETYKDAMSRTLGPGELGYEKVGARWWYAAKPLPVKVMSEIGPLLLENKLPLSFDGSVALRNWAAKINLDEPVGR